MQRFALRLLATAAAVLLASTLFPQLIQVNSDSRLVAVIIFALVLGVLIMFAVWDSLRHFSKA